MLAEKAPDGRTRSQEIIDRILLDARSGKGWALKLVLDRILPAVTKHEHEVPAEPRSHRFVPDEADQHALRAEFKGNGHDKDSPLQ